MNERIRNNANLFVDNYNTSRKVYMWDGDMGATIYAAALMNKKDPVNKEHLLQVKKLISSKTGLFSSLGSGNARMAVAASASKAADPEDAIDKIKYIYGILKKRFWASDYLAFTSTIIYDNYRSSEYEDVVGRTREIYDIMQKSHPFLTSYEDISSCLLMAMSGKDPYQLIADSDECYKILNPDFFSKQAVQTMSNVLSIYDGSPEVKCKLALHMFNDMRSNNFRINKDSALPLIASLAITSQGMNSNEIIEDIKTIDNELKKVSGLGAFGVGTRLRNIYSIMIVQNSLCGDNESDTNLTAVNSTIAAMIAQEAAVIAAVTAANVAASSSSSLT